MTYIRKLNFRFRPLTKENYIQALLYLYSSNILNSAFPDPCRSTPSYHALHLTKISLPGANLYWYGLAVWEERQFYSFLHFLFLKDDMMNWFKVSQSIGICVFMKQCTYSASIRNPPF